MPDGSGQLRTHGVDLRRDQQRDEPARAHNGHDQQAAFADKRFCTFQKGLVGHSDGVIGAKGEWLEHLRRGERVATCARAGYSQMVIC